MASENIEQGYFEANKPSIIDLFALDNNMSYQKIIDNINKRSIFSNVSISDIKDNILHVRVTYKDVDFNIYLKIMENRNSKLEAINKVLVDDETIKSANNANYYIKSYVDTKHDYVKAYYAQIKLLAIITDNPLLIVDCTQWCIYSATYINHFLKYNIDIIDSNLFKVKYTSDGCLYTEGLERFGIKDIEMNGISAQYQKACASFLSRLSRFFIENGQMPNTCQTYTEVFESPFYACLVDIEFALNELEHKGLINMKKRDKALNTNRLFVSVHSNDKLKSWYSNEIEVLDYLKNSVVYYTSQKHFEDEKKLAQETILDVINVLSELDDQANLMILARNEEISTDWYSFYEINGTKITMTTNEKELIVDVKDIINWSYRGISPLYAYALEI
ncbi:uncharacterized protein YlaN (UPF0358 family) [Bacilli bacterium PM5-3]|nr:uncharacterized protein YlaN (UPF0358 family) [Bacilli bacterium PM5-3]